MFNNCDLFVDIRGVARQKGAVGTICGDSKFKGLRTTSSITQKLARYRSNQSVPIIPQNILIGLLKISEVSLMVTEGSHESRTAGAVLAPPLWGERGQWVARDLRRVAGTGKILSVICTKMQFVTYNQHIVTKFSSEMPSYTYQKFRLGDTGGPDL